MPSRYLPGVNRPRLVQVLAIGLCTLPAFALVQELRQTNPFLLFGVAIAHTGQWALRFLLLTLACSPLRALTRWGWPAHVRRILGLSAFAYALLHAYVYVVTGQHGRMDYVLADAHQMLSRPPGWLAFLLLIPLALTSTKRMVQRVGGRRWKTLHRAAYIAAFLGVVHLSLIDAENHADFSRTYGAMTACACLAIARLPWRKFLQRN